MGTANNHYFPSKRMQEDTVAVLGFAPLVVTPSGAVATREHDDGRLQTLYVFPWSNYRIAERDGKPPCNFCLRVTLDMPRMALPRVRQHASAGVHTTIWFDRDTWPEVAPLLVDRWKPALDAPMVRGEAMLRSLASSTVHVPGLPQFGVRA